MRKLFQIITHLAFIQIIFFSNILFAQISVDNINTRSDDASSKSFTHTVSGTDRLLIVGISLESGDNSKRVSNVTYKGQNLTRIGEAVNSANDPRADVWMLVNPPTGSNTVTVTFYQKVKFNIGAISFTGVNQSNPVSSVITGKGLTGSPSVTVSSSTGDLVMDVVASLKNPSYFHDGWGQTQRWKVNIAGSGKTGAASTQPGANSVIMSWSGNEKWAAVGFNIKSSTLPIFRSKSSGDWNSASTWEVSTNNGVSWISATSVPNNNNVTIMNGHTLTVSEETSVDSLIIDEGGILIANANITFNHSFIIDGTFNAGSFTHTLKGNNITTGNIIYGMSTFVLNGTSEQTINGSFYNLIIDNTEGINLLSETSVNGTLTFINGYLNTGLYTLDLGSSGSVAGEATTSYLIGKLSVTRTVNGAEETFGGIGVIINPGSENLGSTEVIRISGPNGIVEVNGNQGIARKWIITPSFNPEDDVFITFTWLINDNNSLNFPEDYMVYSSPDGNELWEAITPLAFGTTTVTFAVSGFSTFTVGDGNTSPLPVELTSFNAVFVNNVVKITWTTETEMQNHGFDIERMYNDGIWEKIGFVEGNGNSNSPKDYVFVDENINKGYFSYRLKQIDIDGSYKYYEAIKVMVDNISQTYSLKNYPNPFNPATTIIFELPKASNVTISVFNILGQRITEFVYDNLDAGVHKQVFDAGNLSSGTYIYLLETNEVKISKTFTLIK
jgi:hypothetical protein